MTKRLEVRARASQDLDEALESYAREAPHQVESLLATFERVFRRIARLPASGSPRYALELGVQGLRHVTTPRLRYLIFYVELGMRVDVVRVLHEERDLPRILASED
jgi:toxin ParE1/3/4